MGKGKPDQTLNGDFRIRNNGFATLAYRIGASCGCTHLSPQHGELLPGETQEVHVAIRLGQEGINKVVTLKFESNDAQRPEAVYLVRADCPAPFSVTPETVDFGLIPPGNTKVFKCRVTREDEKSFGDFSKITAISDLPYIHVAIIQASPSYLDLEVELMPSAPTGRIRSRILLDFKELERQIEIPVIGEIATSTRVIPSTIAIPLSSVPGSKHEIFFFVRGFGDSSLGRLDSSVVPRGVYLEQAGDRRGNFHKFRIYWDEKSDIKWNRDLIRLKFHNIESVVEVPIVAVQK